MQRLKRTARDHPDISSRLLTLPMYRVFGVGGRRIGVVHGDAQSLAGWGFAEGVLATAADAVRVSSWFAAAQVDVFACTHTCTPVLWTARAKGQRRVIVNNGSAGMPNFAADAGGLITRIAVTPASATETLYGCRTGDVFIDAVRLPYDKDAWMAAFLRQWPPGSPAHVSYADRIRGGPDYRPWKAVRAHVTLP